MLFRIYSFFLLHLRLTKSKRSHRQHPNDWKRQIFLFDRQDSILSSISLSFFVFFLVSSHLFLTVFPAITDYSSTSAASLWHGTFRQTKAVLFGQCFLLNCSSFIFTHGAFLVPEQLYTWLHLELKEQAESLSPGKEQQHSEFKSATCLWCSWLHSLSKKRKYFTLIKWPGFRQGHSSWT